MEQLKPKSEKKPKYETLKAFEKLLEKVKKSKEQHAKIEKLYKRGDSQIAKKLGEEVVELVIASENKSDKDFLEESADVLFYYLMALHARGFELKDTLDILEKRLKI